MSIRPREANLSGLLSTDTDLAAFCELYKRFGIDLKINRGNGIYEILISESDRAGGRTSSEKFGGYGGFFSSIQFDRNGAFMRQEFLE